jgi:hypothetical protein
LAASFTADSHNESGIKDLGFVVRRHAVNRSRTRAKSTGTSR